MKVDESSICDELRYEGDSLWIDSLIFNVISVEVAIMKDLLIYNKTIKTKELTH